jgi:hypothetical protein
LIKAVISVFILPHYTTAGTAVFVYGFQALVYGHEYFLFMTSYTWRVFAALNCGFSAAKH